MWMQIFGAIAKGYGNAAQAQGEYAGSELSSDQLNYNADQAEAQGEKNAALIRRAGQRVLGSQRAGYAASGVQIGEGSAGEVERETTTNIEHDAFQAILQGQRQALAMRTQAKLQHITARANRTAVLIDPLFANGNASSGWKTYNPTQYTASSSGSMTIDSSGYGMTSSGSDLPTRGGA